MTDPPLQLVLGAVIKLLRGGRLVHWAQDIYPELAESLGVLRPAGLLANVLRLLSNWGLRRCDAIVAVGHCMKDRLVARGVNEQLIRVIPNWHLADSSAKCRDGFRTEHDWENKFVVMYSGNFGLAHTFDAVLAAAHDLDGRAPHILFAMVGGGPRLAELQHAAGQLKLQNIRWLPFQPRARLNSSLAAGDLHLATMRQELCGLVVPSKVYGVLAAGRPCIFVGPDRPEVARLIHEYQCGDVVSPNDSGELTRCIETWANDPERLRAAGLRARHAAATASFASGSARFLQLFHELMA